MKTIGLIGLLSLLLIIAYHQVAVAPSEAAQSRDPSVTLQVPAVMGSSGDLPTRFSDYVYLHQTRDESIPVHALAGGRACPE